MGRMFVDVGYIMKVNINNLNSSENPGNLVLLKKLQNMNGEYFAYVSGQAFRYYLKQTLMQMGMHLTKIDGEGKPVFDKKEVAEVRKKTFEVLKKYKSKKVDEDYWTAIKSYFNAILKEYPDIDLFGFMDTESNQAAIRRWSPVKVSPLISVFPWKGETDLLTQKKEGRGELVKVEVNAFNFMRGTTIINVDEVGSYVDDLNWEIEDVIGPEKRKERIGKLLDAIKNLNGGGKIARLLDDLTPKFIIMAKQSAATPIFLNSLDVNEDNELNVGLIQEALSNYDDIIEDYVIGLREGIFANEQEIRETFGEKVKSVKGAIETAKSWL